LDEIADFLGVTPEEVATALVAEETDERAGVLLAVVRAWKAHPDWSARQIARATGADVNFVLRHVEQLGGKIEAVERHRAGGGKKFSPGRHRSTTAASRCTRAAGSAPAGSSISAVRSCTAPWSATPSRSPACSPPCGSRAATATR